MHWSHRLEFLFFFLFVFDWYSVFIWSYCEWLIANCHQNVFRYDDTHFKSNKIVPRLTQFSIDSLLKFTMQCNALCSQFSFMSFYMFLVPLELYDIRKQKNSALQQKRGIWQAFQISKAPRYSQRATEFRFEWFHFSSAKCNAECHPFIRFRPDD